LVAFLVSRFLGFSFADFQSKDGLHIVVLDDTLSMNDQGAFDRARKYIEEVVVKEVGKSTTKDRIVILPISQLFIEKDQFQPKVYQNIGEGRRVEEIKKDLAAMKVSNLHLDVLEGLEVARKMAGANVANRVVLHVISDLRQGDWAMPNGEKLYKKLSEINKLGVVINQMKDVAVPLRANHFEGQPKANGNLAVIDFRAVARIIGQDMPVKFEATIANYDTEERGVDVTAYDENKGTKMDEVDFNRVLPIRIPAGETAVVGFDKRFNMNLKPGDSYFANISVRLLDTDGKVFSKGDGLPDDNIRFATVEVRQSVPILIVDGARDKGRLENGDSFFIRNALISVPGASYDVEFGDVISGGASAAVLERGDLSRYPCIFMLNVESLNQKQQANLEKYVTDGGGVAFFLGSKVDADFYSSRKKNDEGKVVYVDDWGLYKNGKGIFPVPLSNPFYPADTFLKPEVTNMEQILLRDDLFPDISRYPIFGEVFKDKEQRFFLRDLPIKRYFKVPRADWTKDPSKVDELATLPNDSDSKAYVKVVLSLVGDGEDDADKSKLAKILGNSDYEAYKKGFALHQKELIKLVNPTSEKKAYHLAAALKNLLEDPGRKGVANAYPSLKEFWEKADPLIIALRNDIRQLHDQVKYGDPFMVLRRHGNGQVVAVMTTAGKEWNDWGGGSSGAFVYQPIIWETLNQLSSKVGESKRLVGSSLTLTVDKEQFAKQGQLKMVRTYYKPVKDAEATQVKDEKFGTPAGKDLLNFTFDRNLDPGLYVSKLYETGNDKPLAVWGHVFNIDAETEGKLERVAMETIKKNLPEDLKDKISIGAIGTSDPTLANRQSDFSESPWLFLIFLFVLVAEQALAVHLSFHLKGGEADLHAPKSGHAFPAQAA
jgi:hypothetical protein